MDLPFRNILVAGIAANLLLIGIILVIQGRVLPPQVPVFYGFPEGEEQLTKTPFLVAPSVTALMFTLANTGVALFIRSALAKNILVLASSFLLILSLVTTVRIVFLVGNL